MATGDNLMTAIAVGRNCGIIDSHMQTKLFLGDLELQAGKKVVIWKDITDVSVRSSEDSDHSINDLKSPLNLANEIDNDHDSENELFEEKDIDAYVRLEDNVRRASPNFDIQLAISGQLLQFLIENPSGEN